MDVKQAYDIWADQYDNNSNKTRDLEAIALRTILQDIKFSKCLEIGCGTGKNTEWLANRATEVLAVDFSEEMLARAKNKIAFRNVDFIQADITEEWSFIRQSYDLLTFSLVLEHIEDLNEIFCKAFRVMNPGGIVYVGELHPFKQYNGSKARFETPAGLQVLTCFNHHLSDFTSAAIYNGFTIMQIQEYFDDDDRNTIPRILALVLRKP